MSLMRSLPVSLFLALVAAPAAAQPEAPTPVEPAEPTPVEPVAETTTTPEPTAAEVEAAWAETALEDDASESLQMHGWVSQGVMASSGNNYLANTTKGSFEFFEAGLNVTKELGTNLRAGVQIFAQDLGPIGNYAPIIDWAYVDYRSKPWLGVRAGRFKMPLYLYNERMDTDMTRTTVLMPQAVYDQLRSEVQQYSAALADRPHVIVLTKRDLLPEGDAVHVLDAPGAARQLAISSASGSGLEELKEYLFRFVAEAKATEVLREPEEWPSE